MSRCVVVLSVLVLTVTPIVAEPPSPFELLQGLRDAGMADLALEYLNDLEAASPSADSKIVFPLERAKARLQLAQLETDEALRDAAVAQAKADFDTFLKNHAKHPRAVEATVALARVLSLQAKGQLARASRMEAGKDDAKVQAKKAAFAAVRAEFVKAAGLFASAAKQLQKAIDETTDPVRKLRLQKEAIGAEFDRGVNQFNTGEAYYAPDGPDLQEKIKAITAARAVFAELGKKDPSNPVCWSARAWVGACQIENNEFGAAADTFKAIRIEAARNPNGQDGVRMVDFFEAQKKYLDALSGDLVAVRSAKLQIRTWLDRDKYRNRFTPERMSMTYYLAALLHREGMNEPGNRFEKKAANDTTPAKLLAVSPVGIGLLKEAGREYKKLIDTDNEYTERAAKARISAMRWIVGKADKKPDEYKTFEEAQTAAVVRMNDADAQDDEAKRQTERAAAVALFERARGLVTPQVSARDAAEVQTQLAYAYTTIDRWTDAAALAEQAARSGRGTLAAKAALQAVEYYLQARKLTDESDTEAREAAKKKALEVADFVEKNYPNDRSADGIRYRIGSSLVDDKQFRDGYDLLRKVTPNYSGLVAARRTLGRAAFGMLNSKDSPLPDAERMKLIQDATPQLAAVPEPTGAALRGYFGLRIVLAQLHLFADGDGAKNAESIAAEVVGKVTASALPEADKFANRFAADEVRLRAVYAQTTPLYLEGRYKELAERLKPSLDGLSKDGPAAALVKKYRDDPSSAAGDTGAAVLAADTLDRFRQSVVTRALLGRVREGGEQSAEQAAELFKVLENLGGSVEATTETLNRLTAAVRPQIDDLRKQNKPEDADKLRDVVGKLIRDQADKEKLAARQRASLGRALRDLGLYEKALEVLEKVPTVEPELLKAKSTELDADKRDAVVAFQIAQIEQARCLRALKQFDKADGLLKAALGPDGKSGWAKSLEFRKEAAFLLQDKAAEAPADQKKAAWTTATAAWTDMIKPYASTVTAPLPKEADTDEKKNRIRQDREKFYPIILDLFVEEKRCLARANTQVLEKNPKRLTESLGKLGDQIARLEKSYAKGLTDEVKERYAALLAEFADIRAGYKAAGGSVFETPAGGAPAAPKPEK